MVEKLKLKATKNKDGKEVYELEPEQLAEIIKRATLAGQATASSQGGEQPPVEEGPVDPLAAMAGGQ
jgi:2-iminoacetate synthase ThiH